MKLGLYSIKDNVTEDCTPPMAFPNAEAALRAFRQSMKSNANVADFDLYYVGRFDSTTMCIDDNGDVSLIDTNEIKKSILESSLRSEQQAVKDVSEKV